jgi:hypothetical protein
MAKQATGTDRYANKAYGKVTMSAANTLTFSEIPTNVNIMDKVAWVLHRLEWFIPAGSFAEMGAIGEGLNVALTMSNSISSLALNSAAIIDSLQFFAVAILAGTSAKHQEFPVIRDFSMMPGGGLIIAPRPLFIAMTSNGAGGACVCECRLYYSNITMSSEDYLDLIDFYRIIA